jgi:hypothetical protein
VAILISAACHKTIGKVVHFTPPPQADPATLPGPVLENGVKLLLDSPRTQLGWTRPVPGPLTAAASCSQWITACVGPGRTLDDCARSVPACATAQPWNEPACCPPECFQQYATARVAGTKDTEAFLSIYLDDANTCIPGLAALVAGK